MKNLGKIGDPEDLVTKKYVDDLFSGGGTDAEDFIVEQGTSGT